MESVPIFCITLIYEMMVVEPRLRALSVAESQSSQYFPPPSKPSKVCLVIERRISHHDGKAGEVKISTNKNFLPFSDLSFTIYVEACYVGWRWHLDTVINIK